MPGPWAANATSRVLHLSSLEQSKQGLTRSPSSIERVESVHRDYWVYWGRAELKRGLHVDLHVPVHVPVDRHALDLHYSTMVVYSSSFGNKIT